ncbi:DddA-like double-stranded DNA deaminase toxin [Streptomyces sp. NPDC051907]|uniref:DddA-like double-stranded DNA deaminase toxin n=1 Tax=Streptomyces sp. NPDC051907 TaxID=3155284 RepID=UPI0034350C96
MIKPCETLKRTYPPRIEEGCGAYAFELHAWRDTGVIPRGNKYAISMDEQQIKEATVVINNNKGVCEGRDTCSDLVEASLPKGHTLTVYHPGKGIFETLTGKGPGRRGSNDR